MTVVDSHLHLYYLGRTAQKIVAYLDANRIDCCWLLTWEEISPGPWPYHHLPVEEVYEAYQKYPSRVIPFYAPDPHREDAADRLIQWHEKGVRGCGELKATLNWDSDSVRRLLSTTERLGMPVVFHMEDSLDLTLPRSPAVLYRSLVADLLSRQGRHLIRRHILGTAARLCPPFRSRVVHGDFPGYMLDLASLERALRDYPRVRFVAHGPLFWKHISADAANCTEAYPKGPVVGEGIIYRLLRQYPNLNADISAHSGLNALARDEANARRFLSEFDDRILYGTDNKMLRQREFLDSLKLSHGTYGKLYGGNACRLIGAHT
jgi:predicted TIM-barrel fold metal-dependent hydrolase